MAFFRLDKLMWFIVFTTPLSLNLEELEIGGVGMLFTYRALNVWYYALVFFEIISIAKSLIGN